MYLSLLHYLTAYSLPSPSNSHCPLIPKLSSLIVILVPWSSIYILVSRVLRSSEVVVGSLSSSEADSNGGVIGLAISLPLNLVDALDLVEDDFFSPPKIDLSNFGLDEFQKPEFEGYGPKTRTTQRQKVERFSKVQIDHETKRIRINKWYQSLCSETLIKKLQSRRTLYSIKEIDLETTQNNYVAKLPLLKQGDYEMWKLRIEQYFQVQDYDLWEKAQKKNDVKARSMLLMALPNEHQLTFSQYKDAKTLFEAIQARFGGNEATKKTQRTLLKQMYENFSASSQESLDSISNRLQKIVSQLAILVENISQEDLNFKFLRSLPSEWSMHVVVWRYKPYLGTISFDDLYNNFKIVEQEVKRSVTSSSNSSSQNVAFVSTPGSSNEDNTTNVHVNTASTNVSTTSTNDSTASLSDATIYAFLANQPNGSQVVHEDLEQIHEDDLKEMDLKWQLALLSLKARKFYQRTGKKIIINGSDTSGYDKSKVECFNCHKMGYFARECRGPRNQESRPRNQESRPRNQESLKRTVNVEDTSSKAMVAFDGSGFDWSFMADESLLLNLAYGFLRLVSQILINNRKGVGYNDVPPPPTGLFAPPTIDLSSSGLKEFQQPEFEGYGVNVNKSVSENSSNEIRNHWCPISKIGLSYCDED
ncbi:putative ribonuclease H-like domain-containing protein [Tanacetum coccineum]